MTDTPEGGRVRVLLIAATAVFLVDQATKAIAVTALADAPRAWGPLTLTLTRNLGGPFGVFPGSSALWTGLTATVLVAAVALVSRRAYSVTVAVVAGLVIGGGLGNLVDRLVRAPGSGQGGVVDWMRIDPYPKVFNLADVAIRFGALALVVIVLLAPTTARTPASLRPKE